MRSGCSLHANLETFGLMNMVHAADAIPKVDGVLDALDVGVLHRRSEHGLRTRLGVSSGTRVRWTKLVSYGMYGFRPSERWRSPRTRWAISAQGRVSTKKKKNRTAHVLGKILCANKSQGGRNNVGNMSSSETQPEKLTNQGWKLPHHLLEDTFIIRRHSAGRRSRRDHQRLGLSAMQQHQTPSRCTHRLDRQVHGMLAGRRTSSRL